MKKQFNLHEVNKIDSLFEAPENYFDTLPQRIQRRVQQPQKQGVWQLYSKPKYALVLASVIILLVFGGKFLFPSQENNNITQLADIPEQQIRQYLLQEGIPAYDLVDLYIKAANEQGESQENILTDEILEGEIDIEAIQELL